MVKEYSRICCFEITITNHLDDEMKLFIGRVIFA